MDTGQQMDAQLALQVITMIAVFGGFIVTLMIRGEQSKVKEELNSKISGTAQLLAVHTAQDSERFDHLNRSIAELKDLMREHEVR